MADAKTIDWIVHWDCYPSPHSWWILAYTVSIICIIFNVTLLILNIRQLCIKKEVKLDSFIREKPNQAFYLLIVIIYTLGPCVYFVIDSLQLGCATSVYWFLLWKATGLQIMTLATEMLYLFYVLRIKRVFSEIPGLRFPKYQLYFLYFGFIAQIICQCVSYWYYLQAFDDMSIAKYRELALQWGYGALSFYILFVIIILVTFYYKVYQLLHHHLYENEQGKKAAVFAIRYLWLAAIALFTTMALHVVSVLRSKAGLKMSIIMIKNMCLVIDTVVNVICLYLQFTFADTCYFKLCSSCHLGWMKLFGLDTEGMEKKKKKNHSYKSGDTGFTTTGDTVETTINLSELDTLSTDITAKPSNQVPLVDETH